MKRYIRLAFFCLIPFFLPQISSAKTKEAAPKVEPTPSPEKIVEPKAPPKPRKKPRPLESTGKFTNHRDAYKNVKKDFEHINIKVTPAEKRGKPGFVEVELYNNSDFNLSVVKFDITFESDSYFTHNDSIQFENMDQGHSAIQYRRISDGGKMPPVTKVKVTKIEMIAVDAGGVKSITLPVLTEVVKS